MNAVQTQNVTRSGRLISLQLLAALLVAAVLTGFALRLGISDRAAFFALVVIGMALCGMGKLGKGDLYGWWNVRHLLGYALGGPALFLAAAVLFGWQVPGIASERAALVALAVLMLVKTAISWTYPRRG